MEQCWYLLFKKKEDLFNHGNNAIMVDSRLAPVVEAWAGKRTVYDMMVTPVSNKINV